MKKLDSTLQGTIFNKATIVLFIGVQKIIGFLPSRKRAIERHLPMMSYYDAGAVLVFRVFHIYILLFHSIRIKCFRSPFLMRGELFYGAGVARASESYAGPACGPLSGLKNGNVEGAGAATTTGCTFSKHL